MKTNLYLFLLTFLISTAIVGQHHNAHKPINANDVQQIEIMKINKDNPHKYQSKYLLDTQFADFVQKWNTAKQLTNEKFRLVDFYIIVTLQSGEKRQFTVSGGNSTGTKIQENDHHTYEIKDKGYFENLWLAIR